MGIYVFIDVSRKQQFIYRNNQLKDNLYNSFIIKAATEKLTPIDEQKAITDQFNWIKEGEGIISLEMFLEKSYRDLYEFKYSGGGNSIIYFYSEDKAKSFVEEYSLTILKNFPELELYISYYEIDEKKKESIPKDNEIRKLLHQRADDLKDTRRTSFRRWSYGVEIIDDIGLPLEVTKMTNRNYKEIKNYMYKSYLEVSYKHPFNEKLNTKYVEIIDELENYKKDDEKSYIGIISIDGNKMGEMVNRIEHFHQLKDFSQAINQIYLQAIIKALNEYGELLFKKGHKKKLLFTPIVQAGDDICIILEAQYAIEITAKIIENIESLSKEGKNLGLFRDEMADEFLTACGGVAIARNTYPFF